MAPSEAYNLAGLRKRAAWIRGRTADALREDGVWNTTRRGAAFVARRIRARRLPPPPRPAFPPISEAGRRAWPTSVVILASEQIPQCYRYRVQQKIDIAHELGVPFFVADPRDVVAARSALQLGSISIIYRWGISDAIVDLVTEAQRLGQAVIYETDDLVHRTDVVAANPNLATLPTDVRDGVIAGAEPYLAAMRLADHVLASTQPLADDMATEVPGHSFVVENGLDDRILNRVAALPEDPAYQRWQREVGRDLVISYGSGSRAHDLDLAVAAPGIAAAMAKLPRLRVKLIGPLAIPNELRPYLDRVSQLPELTFDRYILELATSHITIAPLLPEPFNEFKSHVKYLEAGAVKVPLIASPTVYANYVLPDETAILAVTNDDWERAIIDLAENPMRRTDLAAAAANHVQQWRLSERPAEQFRQLISALSVRP